MTEVGSLKWIEVGVLLLAGGLFVWWQLRDVRQAQEQSRRQAHKAPEAGAVDSNEGPRA
jgi:predicted negative regulator of RcsB-dependent stress response